VGVLGGTFDPPHIGHLVAAQEAWWQLRLHEVRLVPAGDPPHKPAGTRFPADLRVRLVARAIEGHPAFTLSRAELEREGPSYTVDTLAAVAAAEPDVALWFILGGDQLMALPTWHDPGRLLRLARLAVVRRPGQDPRDLADVAATVAPGRVDWVDMPEVGVSSSMLRERLAAGRPVRYLVPPGVAELLAAEGLVRGEGGAPFAG
jgi:nicotinate-nucleotide adenylyltransferase